MSAIAFIFARGGSKGLPGKNIRSFMGKPLIAWSIEQALAVKRIKRVIVSTDSAEIAAVALDSGAEVPFIRPKELAQDDSPEWLAWRHALNYVKEADGKLPEILISIPATSPLRLPLDIENCLDAYGKGDVDSVITMTSAHRSPYFNMVKKKPDGNVELINKPQLAIARRQEAPLVYDVSTVCYVVKSSFVLERNSIFEGRVRGIYVPPERAIDIDTLLDFQIAQYLMSLRGANLLC